MSPLTSHAPAPTRRSGLRRDIQGLRALAVVAVILDHLLGGPGGGFAGVDVFFVVSGFLITGHLLRPIERDGRVPFVDFYRRRVKRILPAALLVLIVGTAASFVLLTPARFATVLTDAVWAAFFGANWHFLAVGTDYFQAAGPVSPFQHFWSLGVEEQYYLVWPWLLLLLVLLGRRIASLPPRVVIGAGAAVLTLASFAWALHETATEPTWAYFSTASRAWELGVGALLAVAVPALERISQRIRPVLAWSGLALILAAFAVLGPNTAFPAPAGALPVTGAALVVAAGTGAQPRGFVALTNPVAVRLGDLSYSLYLWHFPVIVLLPALLPPGTPAELVLAAVLILGLSVLSFAFVEEPVRRSRLFERRGGRGVRRSGQPRPRVLAGAVAAVTAVVVAGGALAVAGGAVALNTGNAAAPSAHRAASRTSTPAVTASPTPTLPSMTALTTLQAEIRAALAAKQWPALHPDVASVGAAARVTEWTKDGCLTVSSHNLASCTWGSAGATKTAVVIGDSIALSWLPAIRGALQPAGYRVVALDMAQCPAAQLRMSDWTSSNTFASRCLAHLDWAVSRIQALRPALVLASSAPSTQWRLADGATGTAALAEWQRGQEQLIRRIKPLTGSVVVLDPPPPGKALADCDTRFSTPADCAGPLPGYLEPFVAASQRAAAATGAIDLPTAGWFCAGGRCPAFVGTTPVFADTQHLTDAYSQRLAPVLAAALAKARVAFVAGAPTGP